MITLGLRQVCTVGDTLFLTPTIHALIERGEAVSVQFHNDEQGRQVSVLIDNLAEIEFCDWPAERLYIVNKEKIHTAKRALHQMGFFNYPCVPKINLTEREILWAKEFISPYKNPIIIYNNNSGDLDPTNIRAQYVRGPTENMQKMTDFCIENDYTVLQFGNKKEILGSGFPSFSPLNGAIAIRNLDLRQQAACFYHIKKIIGCDSGLYHLMLSVGGKACVSIPNENKEIGYEYWDLLYNNEDFIGPSRIKYVNHGDFLYNKNEILSFLSAL